MGDKFAAVPGRPRRIDDPEWLGSEARRMAKALLADEKKPIGDTVVNAAERLGQQYRLDPQIILQGHQREPRVWLAPRWLALFRAYHERFSRKAVRAAAYEENRHAARQAGVDPAVLWLADLVAGHTPEGDETIE